MIDNRLPKGQMDTIKEMGRLSKEQLKLWVIQELSSEGCAYWLVEAGIEILQKRRVNDGISARDRLKGEAIKLIKSIQFHSGETNDYHLFKEFFNINEEDLK